MIPGAGEPGAASTVSPGDLYFAQSTVGAPPGRAAIAGQRPSERIDLATSPLLFAEQVPDSGEATMAAPSSGKGHALEVLNFDTPAPWVLIMILLLLGWLTVSFHVKTRAGRASGGAGAVL